MKSLKNSSNWISRREFMRISGVTTAGLVAVACGAGGEPEEAEMAAEPAADEEAAAPATPASMYSEAPMLAEMVAAGDLPPVDERLPASPAVLEAVEQVGQYGGTIRRGFKGVSDRWGPTKMQNESLTWYNMDLTLRPNMVESWETNADATEWTFHLREGMRWSDGVLHTADDYLFTMNDFFLNKELNANPPEDLQHDGSVGRIEKIDDLTVRFHFVKPWDLTRMSPWSAFNWNQPRPAHFYKQWHADYADPEALEDVVRERGVEDWKQLFNPQAVATDELHGRPTLNPWTMVQGPPKTPTLYERNPYFWQIDEMGQQLPYLELIRYETLSGEVVQLKAIAGEITWSGIPLRLFPEAKSQEDAGKIRVILGNPGEGLSQNQIEFNLTVNDPIKRQVFQDKRFRFAVSYALDRELINETLHMGLAEPKQVAPLKTSPFYHQALETTAIELDRDRANALLDEIGMDRRDSDGFRLGPDGKPFQVNFIAAEFDVPFGELAMDSMEKVGLKTSLRVVEVPAMFEIRPANEYDAAFIWNWANQDSMVISGPGHFAAGTLINLSGFWSGQWHYWYLSDGVEGEEPPDILKEAMGYFEKAQATLDVDEQKLWFTKVLDIAADNLWVIGSTSVPPSVTVIDTRLVNMPIAPSGEQGISQKTAIWYLEE
jgi:peptide/nickel transport system substrate-binding protein